MIFNFFLWVATALLVAVLTLTLWMTGQNLFEPTSSYSSLVQRLLIQFYMVSLQLINILITRNTHAHLCLALVRRRAWHVLLLLYICRSCVRCPSRDGPAASRCRPRSISESSVSECVRLRDAHTPAYGRPAYLFGMQRLPEWHSAWHSWAWPTTYVRTYVHTYFVRIDPRFRASR